MRVDAATFRPGRARRRLRVTAALPPRTTERARTDMNRASCRGEGPVSATRPKLGLRRNVLSSGFTSHPSPGVASAQAAAEVNLIAFRVPVDHLRHAVVVCLALRGLDAPPGD